MCSSDLFIALFQGFVLQVAWGEAIAVDSCIAVVDAMLLGLAQAGAASQEA